MVFIMLWVICLLSTFFWYLNFSEGQEFRPKYQNIHYFIWSNRNLSKIYHTHLCLDKSRSIWRMATGTLGMLFFSSHLFPEHLEHCWFQIFCVCIPGYIPRYKGAKERKTPIFCYHLVLSHIFSSQYKFNILPTGLTYADLTHDLSKTLFNLHHLKSWLKKMQGHSKSCLVALCLKAGVGLGLVLQFIDLDLVWPISLRTIGYQAWVMINKVDDTDFVCPRKHLPQTLGQCSHPSSSTWSISYCRLISYLLMDTCQPIFLRVDNIIRINQCQFRIKAQS